MNYECHITVACKDRHVAAGVAADRTNPWKYSQIDGDPVLGQKVFAYLTKHDTNYVRLYSNMKAAVGALSQQGVGVVREKIELIMYDTKTGVGQ
jgi:hypothetical protein